MRYNITSNLEAVIHNLGGWHSIGKLFLRKTIQIIL